jgi:hypothetical protein
MHRDTFDQKNNLNPQDSFIVFSRLAASYMCTESGFAPSHFSNVFVPPYFLEAPPLGTMSRPLSRF